MIEAAVNISTIESRLSSTKKTIVYVDDEEHNLRVFKSLFRRFYKVVLFSNPVEALEFLKTEEVEILISDQQMPQMKGTELIEAISKEQQDLITIILTGYSDIEVIKDAINRCGIYRFITKPYDFEELKADFNNALITSDLKKEKEGLLSEIKQQNQLLEQKVNLRTEELASTNNRLIDSLRYAERIQQSTLSSPKELDGVFQDTLVFYKPLDIVSGDFYLFKRIENKIIIGSFDCTGHGVPGAILSMLGSSALDNSLANKVLKPSELLIAINNKLHEILNVDENTNDGMEGGILLYNLDTKKVSYSGAKADLILFDGDKMERVKGNRISLGEDYMYEDQTIDQFNIDASKVSELYLFSDGYRDQINETYTEKYNTKRFHQLLDRIHKEDFKKQEELLAQELSEWKGSADQIDDIMILGFKLSQQ